MSLWSMALSLRWAAIQIGGITLHRFAGLSCRKIFVRKQLPLSLCFAMTHHKSQGATVRRKVDIRFMAGGKDPKTGAWLSPTSGRLYTVLSRLTSLAQARFLANDKGQIGHINGVYCDPLVKNFYSHASSAPRIGL